MMVFKAEAIRYEGMVDYFASHEYRWTTVVEKDLA
jgi:hypothetical protein